MRPLIGITCSGTPDGSRLHLSHNYVRAVESAGGLAMLLPWSPGLEGEVLERLDGLLLSGGGDVDPHLFGEEPLPSTGEISPARDAFELELARRALAAGLPVLGICRGLQVLNIAAGGIICQDISGMVKNPLKHSQQAPRWHPGHGLEVLPGSLLAGLLGETPARVNSFHHQAVARVAPGFVISAWAPDGVVEGLEAGQGCTLGVQFHAEDLWERDARFLNLFKFLVESGAAYRAKKDGTA